MTRYAGLRGAATQDRGKPAQFEIGVIALRLWPFNFSFGKKAAGDKREGRLPEPSGYSGDWWGNIGFIGGNDKAVNFANLVTDPTENSAVNNCLAWITRNWPQARPVVMDGNGEVVEHPVIRLLMQPTPWYNGNLFQQAMIIDRFGRGHGNAIAYIVMLDGEPVEFQWLPAGTVVAKWDSSGEPFYEYQSKKGKEVLPFSRVLHWRNGIDPQNPLLGVDPFRSTRPEIATDNIVTTYQYNAFKNGGVPPWIVTPRPAKDGEAATTFSGESGKVVKQRITEFGERAEGIALPGAIELHKLGFAPREMVFGEAQRKAEERIAGAIGLPAIIAQLGAGLDKATYANGAEFRQAAWEDCVIPLQDEWAAEVTSKVLRLFDLWQEDWYVTYDRSQVRALADDETAKAKDSALLFEKQVIDRAEALRRIGVEPAPEDEGVYFGQQGGTPVDEGENPPKSFAVGFKFNPRHSPNTGQFAEGGGPGSGGASGGDDSGNRTAEPQPPNKAVEREFLRHGGIVCGAAVQRYCETANEAKVAKSVKGRAMPDNEPIDIHIKKRGATVEHGIELKTMVSNKQGKIQMKPAAIRRKRAWEEANQSRVLHTVVYDDRKVYNAKGKGQHGPESDRQIYYRRGYGSFSVSAMEPVRSAKHLQELIHAKDDDLPPAARRK